MIRQVKIFLWFVMISGFFGSMEKGEAINILGVVTSLSKSHSVFANSILNEYANSGHSVTVLSPFRVSPKINHYYLDGLEKLKKQFNSNWNLRVDQYTAILQSYEEGVTLTEAVINHESFRKLIESPLHIDVIIFDYDFNESILGIIAHNFKCPVLILSSSTPKLSLKRSIGLSYPMTNLMFEAPATSTGLVNAFWNVASNLYEEFIVDFYFYKQQKFLYHQVAGESAINLDSITSKSVAKIFTNSLSKPVLMPAHAIDIPAVHIPEKSIFDYSVPDALDKFIHSSDDGCIYVSLGADTDPATLPKDKILTMFQALNSRPEKIIWAWNGNTSIFGKPNKFYLEKWLPQDDVLRHRNIKAFVTNGGVLSLQEAIYHEIPIVGIPLTYDQSDNLNFAIESGLGVKLEFHNISFESLSSALSAVLDHDSYQQRLALESDLIKSRPISPMKSVKYWIDHFYQHRHEGFASITKISTIDYYLSDMYLVAFLILLITSLSTAVLCNKLFNKTTQALEKRKLKMF